MLVLSWGTKFKNEFWYYGSMIHYYT